MFPGFFEGKRVLDVGSRDANGNNRWLFTDCEYYGNDVCEGPNVTIVSKTKDLPFERESFDVVCSTECFEHDSEFGLSIRKIIKLLKPGGLFFFTCASTGRPEHGTRRSNPEDEYLFKVGTFSDHYRNITIEDLLTVCDVNSIFTATRGFYNPATCDLYFMGIKRTSPSHSVEPSSEYNVGSRVL